MKINKMRRKPVEKQRPTRLDRPLYDRIQRALENGVAMSGIRRKELLSEDFANKIHACFLRWTDAGKPDSLWEYYQEFKKFYTAKAYKGGVGIEVDLSASEARVMEAMDKPLRPAEDLPWKGTFSGTIGELMSGRGLPHNKLENPINIVEEAGRDLAVGMPLPRIRKALGIDKEQMAFIVKAHTAWHQHGKIGEFSEFYQSYLMNKNQNDLVKQIGERSEKSIPYNY